MDENAETKAGAAGGSGGAPDPGYTTGGSLSDHLEVEGDPVVEVQADDQPVQVEQSRFALPDASDAPLPRWVKVPKDLKFPRGRRVVFVFFHEHLTDAPALGNRQAILWSLTPEDEKFAFTRAMGDANRAPGELAKQMLRAVDGYVADWSGTASPGSVDKFWREVGGRYRDLLIRLYAQLHVLSGKEVDDFFENCVAVRSTA